MNATKFTALLISLLLISPQSALADTTTVTSANRESHVAELKALYVPQYDAQYARLMAIKEKSYSVSSLKKSWNTVMEDFQDVTRTVYGAWADPLADADAAALYSDEEIGEFEISIGYLESEVKKVATITCVKGKTVKKVTDVNPKCPKGYIKKK